MSFVSVNRPELVLSSLHLDRTGQNLIVRFYNIDTQPVSALLSCSQPLECAWLVNLNEERQELLPLRSRHSVQLVVGKHQVVTVELLPLSK
jgi:alpha-mannosidase